MNFVQYQSCHGIINTARTNSSLNRKVRVHFWHSEGPPSELLSPSASARFVEPRQSRPFFLALSFFCGSTGSSFAQLHRALQGAATTPRAPDQLRDQRGQRRRYCPPFAPWVQWGAGMGWVWSGGSNLASGPLGSVDGDPNRHRGWLLAPLSLLRTGGCRPGPEAARVLGS
jgi:hypothetical protein